MSTLNSPDTLASNFANTSPLSKRPDAITGASSSLPGSARPSLQLNREPLLRTATHTGSSLPSPFRRRTSAQAHKSEKDRTDALWAEMQATLADVEISASRGTHFFGPAHAAALEELRQAQIALAQAWARSEGDNELVEGGAGVVAEDDSQKSPTSLNSAEASGQREAERDLVVARRRKEANDRYFERVGKGVVDVVGRLEEVATAMGKVEKESREVWSDTESDLDLESVGGNGR